MSFKPVLSDTAVGYKGYRQMNGILHLRYDDLAHAIHFVHRHVEVQFVMHLHNHLRLQLFLFQPPVDGDHRHLDDIGGGALDRCINGIAFRERTNGRILRMDIRQVTFAAEKRLGIAALTT